MVYVRAKKNGALKFCAMEWRHFHEWVSALMDYHPERFGYQFIFVYDEDADRFIGWHPKTDWEVFRRPDDDEFGLPDWVLKLKV